ncbi:hypothetical protein ACFE04_006968 [Oxalis oulophora]
MEGFYLPYNNNLPTYKQMVSCPLCDLVCLDTPTYFEHFQNDHFTKHDHTLNPFSSHGSLSGYQVHPRLPAALSHPTNTIPPYCLLSPINNNPTRIGGYTSAPPPPPSSGVLHFGGKMDNYKHVMPNDNTTSAPPHPPRFGALRLGGQMDVYQHLMPNDGTLPFLLRFERRMQNTFDLVDADDEDISNVEMITLKLSQPEQN